MRKQEKVLTDRTVDIFCDICHESCKVPFTDTDEELGIYNFEYGRLVPEFGCMSNRDAETNTQREAQTFELCEKCYNRVEQFIKGAKLGHDRMFS